MSRRRIAIVYREKDRVTKEIRVSNKK